MKKLSRPVKILIGIPLVLFGILLLLVLAVILIFGAKSILDREHTKKKIALAEKNAAAWIQRKYGVTAEPVETVMNRSGDMFRTYELDTATVHMTAAGKTFDVCISGTEENADGWDSYQSNEILNALLEKIAADFPGGTVSRFLHGELDGGLYQAYFDGTNLQELLTGNDGYLDIYYVNTDFYDAPIFNFLAETGMECSFYSFDSPEILAHILAEGVIISPYQNHYAPYTTNYRTVKGRINQQGFYTMHSCADFLYLFPYQNIDEEPENTFHEANPALFDWIQEKDFGGDLRELVSNGYQMDGYCPTVMIFYPLEKIRNADVHSIYAAYTCTDSGEKEMMHSYFTCADYAVFTMRGGENISFVFEDTGWEIISST